MRKINIDTTLAIIHLRLTPHKSHSPFHKRAGSSLFFKIGCEFVPYSTHPNPALSRSDVEISRSSVKISQELFNMVAEMIRKGWASFMLGALGEILKGDKL